MGSGAGLAIEDSAVLAELLAEESVQSPSDIATTFAVFNDCRKERGQWLVRSSSRQGDLYEWRADGVGKDFAKIEQEITYRNGVIADFDVRQACRDAVELLKTKLETT